MNTEVLVEAKKRVATVTLNRPGSYNATTLLMWRELADVFGQLGKDNGLRAVILTGAGRHFSTGQEISEFAEAAKDRRAARDFWITVNGATQAIENCQHPVIAAVNGFALGASMDLANSCDIRVADPDSKWGIPAMRIGVTYGYYAIERLKDLVGASATSWILLYGDIFDARKAQELGIVNDISHPGTPRHPGSVLRTAQLYTERFRQSHAPLAMREAKRIIIASRRARIPYGVDNELPIWGQSHDVEEGMNAFLAKPRRTPRFKGR